MMIPALTDGVLDYTATTVLNQGAVSAEPVNEGDEVTIEVNGEPLSDGDTAEWDIGENTIEITVTGDGHDPVVYTVTLTRKSALSALSLGAATLEPSFETELLDYTGTTSNATNTVTATPLEEGDTVALALNGTPMANTTATWADGENLLEITVGTGDTATTYMVTMTKE